MNSYVPLLFLVLLTRQQTHANALAIRFIPRPRARSVKEEDTDTHANTCQCECCYNYGNQHTECISSTYTMFDVAQCDDCTVSTCASHFPVSCDEPTSVVNTSCVVRNGWILRLVPIAFLIVTVGLLIYGFFFKKFDGYHPVSHSEPVRPRSLHHPDYFSTPTHQMRAKPTLPPIAENKEFVDPVQPR